MRKMSIRDIAKDLNISIATVSYIMNGKAKEKRISDAMTKKVQKYLKEKNFRPNHIAKSLRTGKSRMICFMVESIADNFFANVAEHLEELAYEKGYRLFLCSTNNNTAKTKELINTFRNIKVDAFIITPSPEIENEIKQLIADKIPVILFDRFFDNVAASYIGGDNLESIYNAINHLLENGFKNIAFVTIDSNQIHITDRTKGYIKALKEDNKKPVIKMIQSPLPDSEIIRDEIVDFIKNNLTIDAVFFATNKLAVSGLEAIHKSALNIPSDIGVIVFDDNDLFRIHNPSITTILQPVKRMAEELMNLIFAHLLNEDVYVPKKIIVQSALKIRQSSVRLKNKL